LKDGLRRKVEVKCGVHNHMLPNKMEGHAFAGHLTIEEHEDVKDFVEIDFKFQIL